MKVLVFDIDATLLLSGGAGARALDRAFQKVTGKPNGMEGVPFFGMTDYAIIRRMADNKLDRPLQNEEREEVRRLYAEYLVPELETSPGFKVLDGVVSLLDRVTEDENMVVGLATGNFEETGNLKLARGGLESYFDFGGFGSDFESRPELTKLAVKIGRERAGNNTPDSSIYVIGDTVFDVRCGKEAGVRTIAVATGNCSKEELTAEDPYAVIDDLSDGDRFYALINGK